MDLIMKMAKASEHDIDAAGELLQVLNAIDEDNRFGGAPLFGVPDFFDISEEFDSFETEHLQALYNKLMQLMRAQPSFHNRVIGGMCYVIMYDQNKIVDPVSDYLDLHPRFAENWNDLQREMQAARYWNMRYHQVVQERDQLSQLQSARG